ncbi:MULTISPECIES: hypothetical protein [unclassified Bacillus (in: firmicutes)]|uniref:hypothetical protein n=1 Tax=unclassified Bacillus (in: firmicutes) TaxID=185979 RepID=UPI000AEE56ED|nr:MULTISPECIES: hypothetical protein [unclassified Bacillus (in: firmicutes)]
MADKKRFLLRIDQKTYDALERWANDEFRSVNAQIELLLKKALKENGRLKKEE